MSVGFMCCCHYILFGSWMLHSYGRHQMVSLTRTRDCLLLTCMWEIKSTGLVFALKRDVSGAQVYRRCNMPASSCTPTKSGFRGFFWKIILGWLYTAWAEGDIFPRAPPWFCMWSFRHPESHPWHPIGSTHNEKQASSPFRPPTPCTAFCAN